MPESTLAPETWQAAAAAYRQRVTQHTAPARERRSAGIPHPVEDFLYTYYRTSFAKLEEWHPPLGTALALSDEMPARFQKAPYRRYDSFIRADPAQIGEKHRQRLHWIRDLLLNTRDRRPNFACHGLHEWAMVYRGEHLRHDTPLRLSQHEIDSLVEARPIHCSHFDAFRFFQSEARPLNRLQPELETRPEFEQPGCVHANMDLYKWAFKAMPWAGSELLYDCFLLAREFRHLDMRASPYDLSEYSCEPIRIETADGRAEYETRQRELADRAAPLRQRLIDTLDEVLDAISLASRRSVS